MENDGPQDNTPPPPAVASDTGSRLSDTQDRPTPLATEPPPQHQSDHAGVSSTPTDAQSQTVMSPGPYSSWSTGSDFQLGHQSAPSDISDRVFPIRSVVSVGPAQRRGSQTGEDYFPALSDTDSRGIATHRVSLPRAAPSTELRRSGTLPPTASPFDRAAQLRRKRAMSGPFSSIQADAARQGTIAPLNLDVSASDRESEDSAPLGPKDASADAPRQSSASFVSGHQSLSEVAHMTTRFTHVETEDGHAVITGRDGVLQQCEDEPIHTPGAVQGFGVLLAFREEQDGSFSVRYVSENSEKMLGYSPRQLFKLKSFMDILTEEQQDNLLDHIDFIRDEDADPAVNGPEVLSLSIRPPKSRKSIKLWCAIHINPAHPELIICEFELDDDHMYPLRPVDEMAPDAPHDTLQSNPTLEEIEESTEILSKPLRILRSARKRRGEQGAMQVFDIMSQVQEQLASAPNLDTFLKILVGIVKELTGFHRVMIYQFDASFNGKVVTELVDTSQTIDLYKGLHFPASDIPRQARELYKINKVRLLYDRDLETARIVCRTQEDLETPLDMTHAYLRAMSPIHIKYLANMAVRSSMSISVNAFNELWGLIACHSYGPHGMRVSFPIRKMCRLVGDTASRNIERLSYASRLQARKLINTAPTDKNPSGYIIASSDDLLKLFDADFGLLSIKGETKIMGTIEHSQEALAMLEYLRMRKLTSVLTSQDIREDFPDLRYPPGFQVIAGLLYVPLSVGGVDFIVFFRKGQVKEVKWAGNPYEKTVRQGTSGYLEPRTSFKTWHETVIGKCRDWNEEQVETAAVLCLVYGKFIEVWRQKEAAMQSSKLTRLLLANSAHEVRTPLNAIINYLEIALEGSLDKETRENLARSHSASKSLIYVINDLLDLTKTEEGQNLIKDEIFDLTVCVQEATDPFYIDAKRKGIEYKVTSHPGLPRFVHGDGRRIRQVISNITANAIAHTDSGFVHVDLFVSDIRDGQAVIDIAVADSGAGMSPQQLDALFRDLEQVSYEEIEPGNTGDETNKPHDTRTLGLGLAIVARIVRNMDGQLRLKSEDGQGSRFVVQLPFLLPDESPASSGDPNQAPSQTSQISNTVAKAPDSLKAPPAGEITLIDRGSSALAPMEGEKAGGDEGSARSRRSVGSYGSHGSHQSDADRLIHAIQTPLSLNDEPSGYFAVRRDSLGSSGHAASKSSIGPTLSASPQSRKAAVSSPTQARDEAGTAEVRDTKTRIRAVKVPEEYKDLPSHPQVGEHSRVLFEISSDSGHTSVPSKGTTRSGSVDGTALRTLVAEDDPINLKVLRKRLEKAGHEVQHAVNGEDCATVYKESPDSFDVILMDMQVSELPTKSVAAFSDIFQMPIVDGLTSTKMIRDTEKSDEHKGHSHLAGINGRIPIFAVSASLIESQKQTYVDAGFDGWILKPIDFKRLNTLLAGIRDTQTRNSSLLADHSESRRGGR
ncbi:light-sensor Protein kinase [Purpureocillium lilacinum]|uniref:light-sensor Protein kinase n=1 Tax=Purpureocillium lilacinum TaxID=33203 RepID=UPI002083D3E3|nr:light-sensor Protein kinase [Purpureocillium lilacinum]